MTDWFVMKNPRSLQIGISTVPLLEDLNPHLSVKK